MRCRRGEQRKEGGGEREKPTYCWVKVRLSNQVMMGRFWRSLNVGKITEYMSFALVFDFAGAIVRFSWLWRQESQIEYLGGSTEWTRSGKGWTESRF